MDNSNENDGGQEDVDHLAWARFVQQQEADQIASELVKVAADSSRIDRMRADIIKAARRMIGQGDSTTTSKDRLLDEQLHELDEPHARGLLEMHIEQIRDAYQVLGLPKLGRITASSLPSGTINAMCVRDPADQSLHIFADTELVVFIQSLAKLVTSSVFPILKESHIIPRVFTGLVKFDLLFFFQARKFFWCSSVYWACKSKCTLAC